MQLWEARAARACIWTLVAGALLIGGGAGAVLLPPEGVVLNRIHVQFEWISVGGAVSYQLQVVEDDGSADPFATAIPVVDVSVDATEPRTSVTSGLQFGFDYAWRVRGIDGAPLAWGPTHLFGTAHLPADLPVISTTISGAMEPGLTMFNIRRPGTEGLAVVVDASGVPVWFIASSERFSDLRLLADGRLLYIAAGANRAFETTLGGQVAWVSPDDPDLGLHHEVFPMPSGNYLSLAYEVQDVLVDSELQSWAGSRIVELDRSDNQVVWEWNPFDHYSTLDFDPTTMENPGVGGANLPNAYDWTHQNAVIYDAGENSVYTSSRQISRMTRIDYATGAIVYNMGFTMPSGDTDFGDNLFSFQHAPELQANGNMLLFDNGNRRDHIDQTDATGVSKAVELAFTGTPPTGASIVWEWTLPDYSSALGDACRLPGGTTLVTSGRNGKLHEVDAAGTEVWRLELPANHSIYRAERIPELPIDVPGDTDGDGLADEVDNCPDHSNALQQDCDCDGFGDVCAAALGVEGVCFEFCEDPLETQVLVGFAEGGAVDLTVSGVLISVTTTAGQSAANVIAALVDAINADPTLSVAGISALANGNKLTTNGTIDNLVISDPGLSEVMAPALGPWATVLLTSMLLTTALAAQRRVPNAQRVRGAEGARSGGAA